MPKKIERNLPKLGLDDEITVRAIITPHENQDIFLLIRRDKSHSEAGNLENPGGKKKKNQTILDALKYEVKKETGITINNVDKYLGFTNIYRKGKEIKVLYFLKNLNITSNSELSDLEIKLNPGEHTEYLWSKKNVLPFLTLTKESQEFYKTYLAQKELKQEHESLDFSQIIYSQVPRYGT